MISNKDIQLYRDLLKEIYLSPAYNISPEKLSIDSAYLIDSIREIDKYWEDTVGKYEKVKLILLAEAPLWGEGEEDKKSFIYNPHSKETQFLYLSDLIPDAPVKKEKRKQALIDELIRLGIIIVDFSPFPFKPGLTGLSFRKGEKSKRIKKSDYLYILDKTREIHLLRKLNIIKGKFPGNISEVKICYRYKRVQNYLSEELKKIIKKADFRPPDENIKIWNRAGGIDRDNLKIYLKQA